MNNLREKKSGFFVGMSDSQKYYVLATDNKIGIYKTMHTDKIIEIRIKWVSRCVFFDSDKYCVLLTNDGKLLLLNLIDLTYDCYKQKYGEPAGNPKIDNMKVYFPTNKAMHGIFGCQIVEFNLLNKQFTYHDIEKGSLFDGMIESATLTFKVKKILSTDLPRLFEFESDEITNERVLEIPDRIPYTIIYSKTLDKIYVSGIEAIYIYDMNFNEVFFKWENETENILAISQSSDGNKLLFEDGKGFIKLLDTNKYEIINEYEKKVKNRVNFLKLVNIYDEYIESDFNTSYMCKL